MAILLVEQYYDFARSLADHYVVLSRGEVVKAGKGADMDADGVRACLTVLIAGERARGVAWRPVVPAGRYFGPNFTDCPLVTSHAVPSTRLIR